MKYRKLRIVWSVAWGALCLLLVVLWVRSYFFVNNFAKVSGTTPQWDVSSGGGWLTIRWRYKSVITSIDGWMTYKNPERKIGPTGDGAFLLPYWLPALITGTIAAVPWFRWRFSLRTLLIIMTVAAVALGWIVYLMRS